MDTRIEVSARLAQEAAAAAQKFSAKSPTGADTSALASIALSLTVIAEALAAKE
jgi:hypothetical protein